MNINQPRDSKRTQRFDARGATNSVATAQTCSSCGCGPAQTTAVARYDEDGECTNPFCVSCETQWRLRNCLKLTLCEFVTCVANAYCEDGHFSKPQEVVDGGEPEDKKTSDVLAECLFESLCTTLHCVPDAICGPRQNNDCIPPPALDCNFAVEEKT